MATDEDNETQFFSQFPSHQRASQSSSTGGNLGRGIGFLDLNINIDDFPELGSYQQLLLDEPDVHGSPPIGPGRGRKFKGGNPDYLDMLIELFQGVAVDGSSTYVPIDEEEEEEYVATDDAHEESPMSTTSRKRGSSGAEQSASSPGKKHKSPIVKLMTGLINTMKSENTYDMITEYANKKQEAKDKAKEKKSNNIK
ncbi:hypothetical protein ZWY2020_020710 [Hordeum vulgare]|nr:hypothetical protein ZWY2020_020710 [Hordeum vulgare]